MDNLKEKIIMDNHTEQIMIKVFGKRYPNFVVYLRCKFKHMDCEPEDFSQWIVAKFWENSDEILEEIPIQIANDIEEFLKHNAFYKRKKKPSLRYDHIFKHFSMGKWGF